MPEQIKRLTGLGEGRSQLGKFGNRLQGARRQDIGADHRPDIEFAPDHQYRGYGDDGDAQQAFAVGVMVCNKPWLDEMSRRIFWMR